MKIESGFSKHQAPGTESQTNPKSQIPKYQKILDRKEAIKQGLTLANQGDIVVITGKGSETSIAVAGGRKIPWSDKEIVEELLNLK